MGTSADFNYGERRAVNEMESILRSQWANGMLPHIRFTPGETGYGPDAEEWGVTRQISGNPDVDTSGITQPPIVAAGIWEVYQNAEHKDAILDKIEEWFPKVQKYHDFLLRERDPDGEHLIFIAHPWASGTDNAPDFDDTFPRILKALESGDVDIDKFTRRDQDNVDPDERPSKEAYDCYFYLVGKMDQLGFDQERIYKESPFAVQDVLVNTVFAESVRSMGLIAGELALKYDNLADMDPIHRKEHEAQAAYYREQAGASDSEADRIGEAIRTKLWDEDAGLFFSYDMKAGKHLDHPTIRSLMPLYGGVASPEQAGRLLAHLTDPDEFWPVDGTPIPSTPMNAPRFDNARYWKGPSWPVTNWMLAKGLDHYSPVLADEVRERTVGMIAEGYADRDAVKKQAAGVMEYNSFGEEFTTPAHDQYCHGWLWDSVFAAIGWSKVDEKVPVYDGTSDTGPSFAEYYAPQSEGKHEAGDPLGARYMTWTGALYLDLVEDIEA
ncbi:MAG: trehalase family glycosidase [Candidatus Undinarchaeales archaeon]|jgi:hypothetical protein|nr:trehalase family glycosidase [Candidatus Undinarchaeales archaeon]MDP7494194.1 trehalase family glycosidase [Candidatus Undinarchaeales archaeon]